MNIAAYVICALLAFATIVFPIGAIIAGKIKLRRALKPIEYYPPRGFSPIDVLIEYYGFRANTHALLNPLMLYWADCGFITIEEDCKRGLKLTKLRDIKQNADRDSRYFELKIDEIGKLKDIDFEAEKTLFDAIFSEGDVFYTLAARSVYLDRNKEFINSCKTNALTVKSKTSKKLSIAAFLLAFLSAVISTLTIGVASNGGGIFGVMLFPIIGMIAFRFIPNESGMITAIKVPFFTVWGGAPLCVVLALIPWHYAVTLAVVVICSAVTIILLADRIDIRDDKDVEIYGRIAAFKTFLIDAEADRINTLVEENPNYYYDVLPYCYILKITDKLKTKFDRIALDGPSWYLGDLRDTLMF